MPPLFLAKRYSQNTSISIFNKLMLREQDVERSLSIEQAGITTELNQGYVFVLKIFSLVEPDFSAPTLTFAVLSQAADVVIC